MAFDFVMSREKEPLIVEISYGYVPSAVYEAKGYWSPDLTWHEGQMWPQDAILTDLIGRIRRRQRSAALRYEGRDGALI
jgi:hypothetical protein